MSTSEPRPLRLAINALFLRHPTTGSGQYLSRLLQWLPSVAPRCQITLFEPNAFGGAVRRSVQHADHEPGARRDARHILPSSITKLSFEQVGMPIAAAAFADVLHYPYWAAPLRSQLPIVVTVHDLIPLLLEPYRGSALVRAYSALVATATKRVTAVIADSACSKRDIVARLGIAPEQVHVIYLAADQRYRPASTANLYDAVCRQYGLELPFLFYVGGLDRRKNVDRLIRAFAEARPSFQSPHLLAIAGDASKRGPLFADLSALARQLGVADCVRFLGIVPDSDLPSLYQGASLVAFPSSYEGFGLPPLEALACGAAVICSNASSLPEVVGDAAISLNPSDRPAWAQAIVALVNDENRRQALRLKGPARAALFSWRQTALQTAAVYEDAWSRWQANRGAPCA